MVELVWDSGRLGTATVPSGTQVTVGEHADFSPDDLMALAVAACLMRTFLRLAEQEGSPILSYAATARAAPACDSGAPLHVMVHAYLVAPEPSNARDLVDRFNRSTRLSPIANSLGDRATITSEVRVLSPAVPAGLRRP